MIELHNDVTPDVTRGEGPRYRQAFVTFSYTVEKLCDFVKAEGERHRF